jgi:hypothetical protein
MDALRELFGDALWPALFSISIPLVVAGLVMRARGRRRGRRVALLRSWRRPLDGIGPGFAVVEGRWTNLDGERGLVEDGAARVLVRRRVEARIDDGAPVLACGLYTGLDADPQARGYREGAVLPALDARYDEGFVTGEVAALERRARSSRRLRLAGGLLFAAGIASAIATAVVSHRVEHDAAGQADPLD